MPAYLFLRTLTLSVDTYHTIPENFIPDTVTQSILPATVVSYGIPTVMLFWFKLPEKFYQPIIGSLLFTAVLVAILIAINSATRPAGSTLRMKVYVLSYIPHLKHTYAMIFVIMTSIHVATIGYILLSSELSVSFTRFLVPAYNAPELNPDSGEAAMFTCLKWNHLFAAAAVSIHGAFTICDLRVSGLINTKAMFGALGA